MNLRAALLLALLAIQVKIPAVVAESEPLRIGFIGSLTSFAGNYGTAVLKGAELAVSELNQNARRTVALEVEDDQSDAKQTVSAFNKLVAANHVQALVGGSWWINAIVKPSERTKTPLLSCETLYNGDFVPGENYFVLQGDLRNWVRAYEPLFAERKLTRAAVLHFTSGFGATLAEEMKHLFSQPARSFVGAIEYSDIQVPNAATLALRVKQLHPDVLYVDAQPAGYASIMRKLQEAGLQNMVILGHSALADAARQKLFDVASFPALYASTRASFSKEFVDRYQAHFHEAPLLNADLGYAAVRLAVAAVQKTDPVAALKSGLEIDGKRFAFDEHNVYTGVPQEIWKLAKDGPTRVDFSKSPAR